MTRTRKNQPGDPKWAEHLQRYFERISKQQPESSHWANGIAMCDRWLSLSEADYVTQEQIDSFIKRLEEEHYPGARWIELDRQFRIWAENQGFKVRRRRQ